ncbi:aldehyde dehydrogenase family protein [Aeoliella sp. SH292]|uniref:aldehyde dehydrogenase family protein n=1 Tax=Aeoliella sp. SH292 TaxID=3454464 RepID=UPI003F9723DF
MNMQKVLLAGEWREANASSELRAHDPHTGEAIGDSFPVSTWDDCDTALRAAEEAASELELVDDGAIASFFDAYAVAIEANAEELSELASAETALAYSPRLKDVELPRTTAQLRKAASAVRDGAWREVVHDTEANIHRCYGPLGPVLVIGPNNFPFAFNAISGGDFVAAIAAGNPVIAKAHPAHPGTSRLLAELAHKAVLECGLPAATVQMLYHMAPEYGLRMVADPRLAAVAFTGSRPAGVAIKAAADAAGKPSYLEMSSVNPVFVLPGAIAERGDELAAELAGSVLLGSGQFCTCPNLFVIRAGADADRFVDGVRTKFESQASAPLLAASATKSLGTAVERLVAAGAKVLTGGKKVDGPGYRFANTLLEVSGRQFLANPDALQTEGFGPATLAVVVENDAEMLEVARAIEGSLTGAIYSAKQYGDDELARELTRVLRRRVGRLLNDKMPTGVAVSPAMNHGGPFPATGHPGFTAVGLPGSIRRFAKLDCYDNVRPERLPACLRTS